ncbi:MAG TPA: TetR/AcrR family transcriptional regulator [Gemmatimonadales bacterium]|nr:TetR/AcrR family transcriptional regulator [Gemmatimonadales bacterium]
MDEPLSTTGEHRAASETQTRILAATRQVYAEAGFRGTTTRRIAQVAGVNEITLFRQFGTKEALVKAALRQTTLQGSVPLGEPKDPPAELYEWAISTYRNWFEGRHLVGKVLADLFEHPELAPDICEEPSCHHAMLSGYLERMRERGLATHDFVPDAAAGMLLGAVFSHAVWREHLADPTLPPPERVVQSCVQLLLAGVGYPPAITKAGRGNA